MIDKKIAAYGLMLLLPLEVGAIPPPDILLSGLQSVVQLFGVLAVFFVSAFFLAKEFILNFWQMHRRWALSLIFVLLLAIMVTIYIVFTNGFTG